jgi:hypothetical protein
MIDQALLLLEMVMLVAVLFWAVANESAGRDQEVTGLFRFKVDVTSDPAPKHRAPGRFRRK